MAPDHLDRFVEVFPEYAGAQDVVTGNHRLQGRSKLLHAFLAIKVEQHRSPVWIILGGHHVVVKNAFLQWCQGIDVLHVGHAARHTGHDAVDGILIQVHQWQHVRGDFPATGLDEIGRGDDFTVITHRSGQRSQRWLTKQDSHVGTQADLTHALDQLHGQQRVPAQFEEMVMTTHLIDAQQVLPDICNRPFGSTLRGLVFTADHRRQIRCRQGLTVQLAVGGQRQFFQLHIGGRDHVVRQLRQ
ncbi:hypothetical protein ALO42_200026 [Pseudomonas syringae pv. atrofaciens]|nr:hypothetical protein ALO42_200026 [Pseudomonas syringae pv. atrofaciens]